MSSVPLPSAAVVGVVVVVVVVAVVVVVVVVVVGVVVVVLVLGLVLIETRTAKVKSQRWGLAQKSCKLLFLYRYPRARSEGYVTKGRNMENTLSREEPHVKQLLVYPAVHSMLASL